MANECTNLKELTLVLPVVDESAIPAVSKDITFSHRAKFPLSASFNIFNTENL
jgi:hypothetical protein